MTNAANDDEEQGLQNLIQFNEDMAIISLDSVEICNLFEELNKGNEELELLMK